MKIPARLHLSDRMANEVMDLNGSKENFEKLTNLKYLICGESGPEKAFSMRDFDTLKEKILDSYLSQVVEKKEKMQAKPSNMSMLRFVLSNMFWMIGRLLHVNVLDQSYCDYKNEWREGASKNAG